MPGKLFCLILLLAGLFSGCKNRSKVLTMVDQNRLFDIAIRIEVDSSMGGINMARHGFNYLVGAKYLDSVYFDSIALRLIDKNINLDDIQQLYKKGLSKENKLISDSFDLIQVRQPSTKTPDFISFSKPISYFKYYLINFWFNSSASGYRSFLIFEKTSSDQFRLACRRVYWLT
jgi:hypothetical protein